MTTGRAHLTAFFSATIALSLVTSCGGGSATVANDTDPTPGDTVAMRHARNLTIVDRAGYTVVDLRNPWDTTRLLAQYLLVTDSMATLPAGHRATVIHTPLRRSVVYSAVHTSLIDELGAAPAIAGVCDAEYIRQPHLARAIADGRMADCGNNMQPDIERIISLQPDAIMLSPYETSGDHGKLSQQSIPIVECADYMEPTPLGRAEWIRFYGRLFGAGAAADSLFAATERRYTALADKARSNANKPTVLVDRIYGPSWSVPGARSTMGRLIDDAGARNIFDYLTEAGSVALSAEQVLFRGGDADVWLIRYSSPGVDLTMTSLGRENDLYRRIKAYRTGHVYGCNTAHVDYYEEMPFHPDRLLADMIAVIHPDSVGGRHRYFTPLAP